MASADEFIEEFRSRGLISDKQNAIIDELKRRGKLEENIGRIAAMVRKSASRSEKWKQRAAEYRKEAEGAYRKQAEAVGPAEAFTIGAGKGMMDIARGAGRMVGIKPQISEAEKQAYGALEEARPISTGIGEAVGETAPFLALGGAASIPTRMSGRGAQIALGAGLGALEGGLGAAGEDKGVMQTLGATALGGALGGVGEAAAPVARRILGPAARRLAGRASAGQEATERMLKAMERTGLEPGDIEEQALSRLGRQQLEPEQLARREFLERQGFKGEYAPTTAQVSRKASDFMTQQELAKSSGKVLTRLENQTKLLEDKFLKQTGKASRKMGELPLPTGEKPPLFDAVIETANQMDDTMKEMYRAAREVSGGEKMISLNRFKKALDDFEPDSDLTKGLYKSIKGHAEKAGAMEGLISADDAERIVQLINQRYSPNNKVGNWIGRELKDAIDLDVAEAGGTEMFKKARKAKAAFHKAIGRTPATRWSKRKTSLISDILDEGATPENFVEKGLFNKKYRASEIKDLKNFLARSGDTGKQAWQNMRSEAMDFIKENSFRGPANEMGQRLISRARFENAIKKIGSMEKMKEIFSPDEMKFFKDMQKILEIMEPTPGMALGEGPSAASVNKLLNFVKRKADQIPILKTFSNLVYDAEHRALLGNVEKAARRQMPIGVTAAGATEPIMERKQE